MANFIGAWTVSENAIREEPEMEHGNGKQVTLAELAQAEFVGVQFRYSQSV